MAEHHDQQVTDNIKRRLPEKGPSGSQVVAVITLFPIGGILFSLSCIILAVTVICLALSTPLFVIFSPILVPAAIALGLALSGFLASGLFGLTGLSSLSWILNYLRGTKAEMPEQLEYGKRRMQDTAGHVVQRTKDVASKAHEGVRTHRT
ncbi:hypothetical protein NE237_007577 [Protea cynaroides]|uniref:Oleosin n=1 Tax=Protea cynaroides TaxID=273540 RepID=A0A9Q0KPD9_9MAGN|nr:hypothetical protein NE237_007577 [Protea cynaroides]